MIVCSCNVFTDHQLRSTLAKATQRPRMSQIYNYLGGSAQCGQCAHTIKRIMAEMPDWERGSQGQSEDQGCGERSGKIALGPAAPNRKASRDQRRSIH